MAGHHVEKSLQRQMNQVIEVEDADPSGENYFRKR